jgi:hypothetical protein
MKTKLIAALLVVASASIATPVLASGYGPAPFYRPSTTVAHSPQDRNTEASAAERSAGVDAQRAYGGVTARSSQSGSREGFSIQGGLFAHH